MKEEPEEEDPTLPRVSETFRLLQFAFVGPSQSQREYENLMMACRDHDFFSILVITFIIDSHVCARRFYYCGHCACVAGARGAPRWGRLGTSAGFWLAGLRPHPVMYSESETLPIRVEEKRTGGSIVLRSYLCVEISCYCSRIFYTVSHFLAFLINCFIIA